MKKPIKEYAELIMKPTIYVLLGLLLFSCRETSKQRQKNSLPESSNADSLEAYSDAYVPQPADTFSISEDKKVSVSDSIVPLDSSNFYVNGVHYFKETNEFYVSLFFNEPYSYEDLPMIRSKLDTVIFRDTESTRKRLPIELGREYFNLHLLDHLRVYDFRHSLISASPLKRVEHLDGPIESEFIAVFDGEKPQEWYKFYGIGGDAPVDPGFRSRKITAKQTVIEQARKMYDLNPGRGFTSSSVELSSMGAQLVSFCDMNYGNIEVTHLLEVKGGSIRRLMRMEEEYVIRELIATSLIHNQKPVLLLWLGIPETDIMWHMPAVYDGDQYQITRHIIYLDGIEVREEPEAQGINFDSVQVFEALKAHPYPSDTMLSGGYHLIHQVFRDSEYLDFFQSLVLMQGEKQVKEFDAYSFGLPYKNIGFIGADFGQTFVFSRAFGSGNPVYIALVEKETGEELLRGYWVDADEKERVLLYQEENEEKLMLFDLISNVKIHVTDFDESLCVDQVIGGYRNCVQIDGVTSDTITLKSEYEDELILKKYSRK